MTMTTLLMKVMMALSTSKSKKSGEIKLPILAFSGFLSLFVDCNVNVCSLRGCVERPDPCNTRPHVKPQPHCLHGTLFLRRRRP
jgi:hypothetical protein